MKTSPAYNEATAAYAPGEFRISRLDTIVSGRATHADRTFFKGGNVLACHAGRFSFSFAEGGDALELLPGETLVLYPGCTVTLTATQKANALRYAVFDGSRVAEVFDAFGFYDRLKFAGCTQETAFDAAARASATDLAQAQQLLWDALATFAQYLKTGAKSQLHEALRVTHRSVNDGKPRVKDICNALDVSRATLNRLFAQEGLPPPSAYIGRLQYLRAHRLLTTTDTPVADIARAVGFATAARFTTFVRQHANASPTELRRRA